MIHFLYIIVILLVTIFALILVHETGHWLTARCFGVTVKEFSLGFGKALWSFNKGNTLYALRWLPLGGYIKLHDDIDDADSNLKSLQQCSAWQRSAVVLAGPLFNIVFAIIAFWCMYLIGTHVIKPQIKTIIPHSIAAQAGLPTQQIISIDGRDVYNWQQVVITIFSRLGESSQMTITTQAANKVPHRYQLNLKSWRFDPKKPDLLGSLGIVAPKIDKLPPKQQFTANIAWQRAWHNSKMIAGFNFIILKKLLTGQISLSTLAGPITLLEITDQTTRLGLSGWLSLFAVLSLSLGMLNLLPLPGLDGGHILYLLIEKARGKPVSKRAQVLAFQLVLIVLAVLIVQTLANDLVRLAGRLS